MNSDKTLRLAHGGLLAALIALLTAYVRIPMPMRAGYAHLGDAGIALAGLFLGPYAAIPAAIGSALADVLAGWASYALFTAVIKCVMGFVLGKYLVIKKFSLRNLLALLLAAAFMVAGYFGADSVMYGVAAAIGSVVGNCVQAVALIALGMALASLMAALPADVRRRLPR